MYWEILGFGTEIAFGPTAWKLDQGLGLGSQKAHWEREREREESEWIIEFSNTDLILSIIIYYSVKFCQLSRLRKNKE